MTCNFSGVVTLRQLQLQQERLYLLNTLASEEEKGEAAFTRLEKAKADLTKAESSGESTNKHRRIIRRSGGRVTRTQKNEQYLAQELARNTSELNTAGNNQWRTAFQEYSQYVSPGYQLSSPTMVSPVTPFTPGSPMDLAAAMQNMNIGCPLTPGHNSPYNGYMSMDAAMQQAIAYGQHMPMAPAMYSQGPFVHGIQPQYYYPNYLASPVTDAMFSPADTLVSPMTLGAETPDSNDATLVDVQMELQDLREKVRPRSMSVGAIGVDHDEVQFPSTPRRFSSIDNTSAGMRLERKAQKQQSF